MVSPSYAGQANRRLRCEESDGKKVYQTSPYEFTSLVQNDLDGGLPADVVAGGVVVPSRLIKTNCDKTIKWENYDEVAVVERFKSFIKKREHWHLTINCSDKITGEKVAITKKNIHRWTDEYLKKRLASLYKLRDWKCSDPTRPSNMWTFTVPHNYNKWGVRVREGANQFEVWENLKQGWDRLRQCDVMRERDYVVIYEPHPETGYPHIHTMNFDDFPIGDEEHIKTLWHEFTGADLLDGSRYDAGKNIDSLVAYLMSYTGKQYYKNSETWTESDWLFNAIAYDKHYRLFSASRNLSKVMKLDKIPSKYELLCENVLLSGLKPRFDNDACCAVKIWSKPKL